MIQRISEQDEASPFYGCDFVIQLGKERKSTGIRLLQLTDMQIIDAEQRRTPDRLRPDEISAWATENMMCQCMNHILSLVAQTRPDFIFITGDIVYGSFDDKGTTQRRFCTFMDSLEIPWAPVFGNHDNECAMGVAWQCEQFEKSKYCVFARGDVSGNGNYTVGIATGDALVHVLHMVDSNGCKNTTDPDVIKEANIYPDQARRIERNTARIRRAQGREVGAFLAFHIPTDAFREAELAKGYTGDEGNTFILGVDTAPTDDDFGFCLEAYRPIHTEYDFLDFLHRQNADGVFVGHAHKITTCIRHEGIRFVFGLKTGQYDYHLPGSLGGTLITLSGGDFTVNHIPSLVPFAPMPHGAKIFEGFFV